PSSRASLRTTGSACTFAAGFSAASVREGSTSASDGSVPTIGAGSSLSADSAASSETCGSSAGGSAAGASSPGASPPGGQVSPSSPITTRTSPTCITSPSAAPWWSTTPAYGEGISTTALSVSTSTTVSSIPTYPPTGTTQRTISASVSPSPMSGSRNSCAIHASSVLRAAATIRSTEGRYWCSERFSGNTLSHPVTRRTGATNEYRKCSAMIAAISAPKPAVRGASWTITARPVFETEAVTASASNGTRLRTSITSAETPSSASRSAAFLVSSIIAPQLMSVTSAPSRSTRARPISTSYQPSGTSSFTAR